MTRRRWIVGVLSGLSTTGLGVFINLATEFKSSAWAWAAVGLLTVMGVLLGVGSERLLVARQSAATEPRASIVNRGTLVTIDGEKNRVKVNVLGAGAMVALSFVVITAVVAGMLTARATATDDDVRPPPSSTNAKSTETFHVTVLDEPTATSTHGSAGGYLFPPDTVSSLPAPDEPTSCTRWSSWALAHGGTRVYTTEVAFTVAALGNNAVRVHSAALVVDRKPGPVVGDQITCAEGGPIPVSYLSLDLDKEQYTYQYPNDGSLRGASRPFGLQIAPGQSEQVQVVATSLDCYCTWYLDLLIEVNGIEHHKRVDDDGHPFVTAPLRGDYTDYRFNMEKNDWEPGIG
jgi:cytochrome b